MKHFIGIDLGDNTNEVCVLDNKGKALESFRIVNDKDGLLSVFNKYPGSSIAIEAGTHALWIHDLAINHGIKIFVANPRKTYLISSGDRKNDKVDAYLLAKLLRSDSGLLFPVTLRDINTQKDLVLLKNRDFLVRQRGDMIRHIRGIIKPFGLKLPASVTTDNLHETITDFVSKDDFECLAMMVNQIKQLSKDIKKLDKKIKDLISTKYPEAELLQTINGVGPITALTFLLIVGNPQRFSKSRKVGSYLGLVPKQDQSGAIDKSLGITKTGDQMMRRLLVNCSHHILGVFGKDTQLRRHGLKIMGETDNRVRKKKAVIAVARKLAVLMHSMLISGQEFKNKVLVKEAKVI